MATDPEVAKAIDDACSAHGQSAAAATMLRAWFEQVALGNESLDDRSSWERHVRLLLEAIDVGSDLEDDSL